MIFEQIFSEFGPIIFALAGFSLAAYVHYKKKTAQPLVCPLNGKCEEVVTSKYSKFFGVPVESLGMAYYALVTVVYALHVLVPSLLSDTVIFLMTGVTIGAFVFSLYLIFIQAFILRKWCTWCLFSAGFSTLIFITAVLGADIDIKTLLAEYKPVLVIMHALAAAVGVGAATITDVFFFRFLKDYKISESEHSLMNTLSNIIWFALGMIIITGVGLYIPRSEELLQSSKFLIKLVAVSVVLLNGTALNFVVSPKMMSLDFGEADDRKLGRHHYMRKLSFALGGISIASWYLVFILGSLKSIPIPFTTALILYIGVLLGAVMMSQVMDRRMVAKYQKEHQYDGQNGNIPSV